MGGINFLISSDILDSYQNTLEALVRTHLQAGKMPGTADRCLMRFAAQQMAVG
jgi:hypothetical protein